MTKSTILVYPIEGRVERHFKSGLVNKNVGSPLKEGHLRTSIDGKGVLIHRLIYSHFHGPMPLHLVVDHINGIPSDNRIENLRLVTASENQQNTRKAKSSNKIGVKGVSFEAGSFRACICVRGKRHKLGRYKNLDDAITAYQEAAKKLHTHRPGA
jgi:hypothetical protein